MKPLSGTTFQKHYSEVTRSGLLAIAFLIAFLPLIECKQKDAKMIQKQSPGHVLDFLQQNGKKFLTFASSDMDQQNVTKVLKMKLICSTVLLLEL